MWAMISLTGMLAFSSPAAAQQSCIASAPEVVDDIFQQVLERPADAGSAQLTQALAAGHMNVRDVVGAVVKSPEYAMRFFWPPVVGAVYRHVLQRPPTAGELRAAATDLEAGGLTPPAFVAQTAARAANNRPDAIRIVYRRLLGRDPDPEGLAAYTGMAERDGLEAVTRSIVASPEYRARATSTGIPAQDIDPYEQSVRALYRHLLGREADPEGLRALAELASVYGAKGPIDRILTSAEYRQRYGEDGIPGRRDVQFCASSTDRRPGIRRPW